MPAVAAATSARPRSASAPSRSRVAWAVSFTERSGASMPAWIARSSSMGERGTVAAEMIRRWALSRLPLSILTLRAAVERVPAGPAPRRRSFRGVPRRRAGSVGRAGGPSGDIDAMEGAVPKLSLAGRVHGCQGTCRPPRSSDRLVRGLRAAGAHRREDPGAPRASRTRRSSPQMTRRSSAAPRPSATSSRRTGSAASTQPCGTKGSSSTARRCVG